MRRKTKILVTAGALGVSAVLIAAFCAVKTRLSRAYSEQVIETQLADAVEDALAIPDPMLFFTGQAIVRRYGTPAAAAREDMFELMKRYDVDELTILGPDGRALAGSVSRPGFDYHCSPKTAEFLCLLHGTNTYVQPFRESVEVPGLVRKYAGVAFPGGSGFLQIGFDLRRMNTDFEYSFDKFASDRCVGISGFVLCVDPATGRVLSGPSAMTGRTLAELGFAPDAPADGAVRRQTIDGRPALCAVRDAACHRFVAAMPFSEVFADRNASATVAAFIVFAFCVIALLVFFRQADEHARIERLRASERERTENDLAMARAIQHSAMPNVFPPFPDDFGFSLFARSDSAREVGGDFYDFFKLDATHLAVLIADVSGKGVPAAMYMMTARTTIRSFRWRYTDPAEILTETNARLVEGNDANMFLTAWMGVLDTATGELVCANAGHTYPLVRRADGSVEWVRAQSGPLLAVQPNVVYRNFTITLSRGDAIVLYTDGVTEATAADASFYGDERLERAVRGAEGSLCDAVVGDVKRFAAGAEQADDITLLELSYFGAPEAEEVTLPAKLESMPRATAFVEGALERMGCPMQVSTKMMIAVDEVASNVVKFSGSPDMTLRVEYAPRLRTWRLSVIDSGAPWNPLTHVDPDITLSVEDRPIGGLGILMVKKLMDDVRYVREGDRNILRLRMGAAGPEGGIDL